MTTIKVLGSGCAKCKQLEKLATLAVENLNSDAAIEKVSEMDDIMAYGVMRTPALVIDEKVYSQGNLPSVEEIAAWLKAL